MSPSPRRRTLTALVGLALAVPLLAACTSTVHLQPAAAANTVGCADLIVHLPKTVEGQKMRDTDAQGTSAWGSPASIVLTCASRRRVSRTRRV
ncbi:hypothetical protein AX769_15550 [Frondihabitans sp. PAMC 28766]|uniref:DUF3515 family protein n=1 Tax=Frondihabitans sp. PAMC 28766 TaxID=1795630 RepID=UPI00078DAC53|nr:DUF3515 family protein [Frondihabitans sp. PAMC 28766]AMM21287.1 hypothetical protein AX769_15550 [Frondihabitans sp. PAMC 28766]